MRRKFIICLIVIFCMICFTEQLSSKSILERFSLKLSGGCGNMAVGDLNTYYDSRQNFFDKYISYMQEFGAIGSRTGDVPHLDKGRDMLAELMVHLTKNFALSIGYGTMNRRAESEVVLSLQVPDYPEYSETVTWRPKPEIVVHPLLFSAYYFLPVIKKLDVYFTAGVGVYYGTQSWEATMLFVGEGYPASDHETGHFKGTGFGFHGGIGAEFKICSWIAIFLEGRARSASIKELKGDWNLYYDEYSLNRSGTIWYVESESFEFEGLIEKDYLVQEDKPDEFWIDSVRNWKVDLSGVSGFIGIRIYFGKRNKEN